MFHTTQPSQEQKDRIVCEMAQTAYKLFLEKTPHNAMSRPAHCVKYFVDVLLAIKGVATDHADILDAQKLSDYIVEECTMLVMSVAYHTWITDGLGAEKLKDINYINRVGIMMMGFGKAMVVSHAMASVAETLDDDRSSFNEMIPEDIQLLSHSIYLYLC